jgi:hypothetical protein
MDSERIFRIWSPMVSALGSLTQESGVFFVDPLTGMCPERRCATYVNGEFIYRDASHLRRNLRPATDEMIAQMMGLYTALDASREKDPLSASNADQPQTAIRSN